MTSTSVTPTESPAAVHCEQLTTGQNCYYLTYENPSEVAEFFDRIDHTQSATQIHNDSSRLYPFLCDDGKMAQTPRSDEQIASSSPVELSSTSGSFLGPPVELCRTVSLDHPYCENKNSDDFAVCREFLYLSEAVGEKLVDRQQSYNMEAVVNSVMQQPWFAQALEADQTAADQFVDLEPFLDQVSQKSLIGIISAFFIILVFQALMSPLPQEFHCQTTAASIPTDLPSCSSVNSQSTLTGKITRRRISSKDDRYREQRDRNNAASRRSRQIRREKRVTMEQEKDRLERQNLDLKYEVARLERLTNDVKTALLRSMATS